MRNPYGEHERPLHPATVHVLERLTELEFALLERALRGQDAPSLGRWLDLETPTVLSRLDRLLDRFGVATRRELLLELAGLDRFPPFVEPYADLPVSGPGRHGRTCGLLAPAEVEILRGLYAGRESRAIAAARGTRTNVAAQQTATACKKLGIPGGPLLGFRVTRWLLDYALANGKTARTRTRTGISRKIP